MWFNEKIYTKWREGTSGVSVQRTAGFAGFTFKYVTIRRNPLFFKRREPSSDGCHSAALKGILIYQLAEKYGVKIKENSQHWIKFYDQADTEKFKNLLTEKGYPMSSHSENKINIGFADLIHFFEDKPYQRQGFA